MERWCASGDSWQPRPRPRHALGAVTPVNIPVILSLGGTQRSQRWVVGYVNLETNFGQISEQRWEEF